jgi:hypothetical protein
MADYQPLIARAVARLAKNTSETRRIVYMSARATLSVQLQGGPRRGDFVGPNSSRLQISQSCN